MTKEKAQTKRIQPGLVRITYKGQSICVQRSTTTRSSYIWGQYKRDKKGNPSWSFVGPTYKDCAQCFARFVDESEN